MYLSIKIFAYTIARGCQNCNAKWGIDAVMTAATLPVLSPTELLSCSFSDSLAVIQKTSIISYSRMRVSNWHKQSMEILSKELRKLYLKGDLKSGLNVS